MATKTVGPTTLKPGQKPVAANDARMKSPKADVDEQQRLRDDLTAAIKAAFTKQEPDARTRFHEKFRKEADEYDRDFHKKYHDDLNTTLIFAGLFSGVATAFIIDIQSQIRPDYTQMSFTVLTMLLNTTSGAESLPPLPTWSGPDPSTIQVQSILFGSLASALLAALLAMLGKQWLNFHVEGSFIDRNRHRELKMRGMIAWRFKFIMECLPLIMQASLLLLGYALAQYLWGLSRTVSSVVIGFTVFGVAFYVFVVVAGTFSKACPFQTPISVAIRAAREHYRENIAEASKVIRNFPGFTRSQARLIIHRRQIPAAIASDVDDQGNEVRAEFNCISTMFKMTKAPDSVTAIMAYIPEIIWDNSLKSIPLLQVYQTLRESLRRSADGKVSPRLGARDLAFWSGKALLHLYIQRRCMNVVDTSFLNQMKLIDHSKQPLGHHECDEDPDLRSTFYIIDWTFGIQPQPRIPWPDLQLTESHHCWLSHILQYRAWDALGTSGNLTDDVRGFVAESLSRRSPTRVVADCLFIVHMVIGHRPQSRELRIKDRSHEITEMIDKIFDRFEARFQNSTSPMDLSSVVDALSLVIQLLDRRICTRCYALFRTIMDLGNLDDTLWELARLSLKGAYTGSTFDISPVGNPKQLLEFLRYHVSPQQRANVGDQPIYHVFSALAFASDEETHRELARTDDLSDPLFIDTTIEALMNKDYKPLRRSTIFMLAQLDAHLFATDKAFRDPGRASGFVTAWDTALHEFLGDPTHQVEKVAMKVLLAIAHLPCLRDCGLPRERWSLIQHFPYIMYANPPPLRRCLGDTTIIPFLKQKQILDTRSPSHWLGMMWMMYHHLSEEVRKQLEKETGEIASGEGFLSMGAYLSLFDATLKNLQTRIEALEPLDRAASDLVVRRELMTKARRRLASIKEDGEKKFLSRGSFR